MKSTIFILIFFQSLVFQNTTDSKFLKSFNKVKTIQLTLKKCHVRIYRENLEPNTITISFKENTRRIASNLKDGMLIIDERDEAGYFSPYNEIKIFVPDGIDFIISMESGDLTIDQVKGTFTSFLHKGEINGKISVQSASSFESESGNVNLKLLDNLNANLFVASGSAKATLDFGGTQPASRITATCFYPQGEIIAPFQFTQEEIFRNYGPDYIKKSIDLEDKNEISVNLSTGAGTIQIKR